MNTFWGWLHPLGRTYLGILGRFAMGFKKNKHIFITTVPRKVLLPLSKHCCLTGHLHFHFSIAPGPSWDPAAYSVLSSSTHPSHPHLRGEAFTVSQHATFNPNGKLMGFFMGSLSQTENPTGVLPKAMTLGNVKRVQFLWKLSAICSTCTF